jgi:putative nucleotidyltransferase with HDIG domain
MPENRLTAVSSPAMPPRLANVPAFPAVVMRLLSLLADESSSVSAIAACIATDPIFAARVLKRANAADLGRMTPARDVLQALVTLGVDRTRSLSLTIATVAYLGSALKEEQLLRCWRHTVACACGAAEIARACGLQPAEPYTAGLLHDIGRFGLIATYPAEYESTVAHAVARDGDLLAFERERFGVDHTEAGRWLAERWSLPASLAEIASRHHESARAAGAAPDTLGVVRIACRLADLLGYGVSERPLPDDLDRILAPLPEPARVRVRRRLEPLGDEIAEQIAFVRCAESRELTRPVEVRIEADEERDFLIDFGSAASPPLPHSRSPVAIWLVGAVALVGAASAVCLCLR